MPSSLPQANIVVHSYLLYEGPKLFAPCWDISSLQTSADGLFSSCCTWIASSAFRLKLANFRSSSVGDFSFEFFESIFFYTLLTIYRQHLSMKPMISFLPLVICVGPCKTRIQKCLVPSSTRPGTKQGWGIFEKSLNYRITTSIDLFRIPGR